MTDHSPSAGSDAGLLHRFRRWLWPTPPPRTPYLDSFDVPPPEPVPGWWCISGEAFLAALKRAHAGESPDLLYAEHYANTHMEDFDG